MIIDGDALIQLLGIVEIALADVYGLGFMCVSLIAPLISLT